MSFQSYITNIEQKTGKSLDEIILQIQHSNILTESKKPMEIINYIKSEFDLGLGHARAIYAVLKSQG